MKYKFFKNRKFWKHIYYILWNRAGARGADDEISFIKYALENTVQQEYRFEGSIGFGGKIYIDKINSPHLRIDCYNEDLNSKRETTIRVVNKKLNNLIKFYAEREYWDNYT